MSSRSRSKGSLFSISSATLPFSALATLWPSSSRLRASSSRFTLLSSATSRRAGSTFIAQCLQCSGDALELRMQRIDAGDIVHARQTAELERARGLREVERAEGLAVRLERMRGAAEALRVLRRVRR